MEAAGKGVFVTRKVTLDKVDAAKAQEIISSKKAEFDNKVQPEGLNWGIAGFVQGAPVPVLMLFSHWSDEAKLKTFQESEGYQKTKEAITALTSEAPQEFRINLLTEATKPHSGSTLEIYSYVVTNEERDALKGEFKSEILPSITKAKGFTSLGFGVANDETRPNHTHIVASIEWDSAESYKAHQENTDFKGVVSKFGPKVHDLKNYSVVVA